MGFFSLFVSGDEKLLKQLVRPGFRPHRAEALVVTHIFVKIA
jgi:hypothetical protein